MSSYLNQQKMNLKERLTLHNGSSVSIQAKGFSSEPGLLQKVGSQFIKVNNQYFNPSVLDQITLFGSKPILSGPLVHIRSTIKGSFSASLIRTGVDFVEIIASSNKTEWVLIPLNKIISIEKR